jgi:hypothetical protein
MHNYQRSIGEYDTVQTELKGVYMYIYKYIYINIYIYIYICIHIYILQKNVYKHVCIQT